MAKKKEEKKVAMTRAQKTEATKGIIKELLAVKPMKHNELIEETARIYVERHKGEDTENINDVKGRVGSVLDIMKREGEVMYDGGMYALKARMPMPAPAPVEEKTEEKPKKTRTKKATVKEEEPKAEESKEEPQAEEKPAPKKRGRAKKAEETPVETKAEETPVKEVKAEPKKRGRKPKATAEEKPVEEQPAAPTPAEKKAEVKEEEKAEPAPAEETKAEEAPVTPAEEKPSPVEEKKEEKAEVPKKEETAVVVKPKAEVAPKGVVMDMSFLIGDVKPKAPKAEEKLKTEVPKADVKEEKKAPVSETKGETPRKIEEKKEVKTEAKPTPAKPSKEAPKSPQKTETKAVEKPAAKPAAKPDTRVKQKTPEKTLTADERLRDAYLKRMRTLGGDYFEYYSVYLLERYSMKNGRRLEGMKISGGGHDGGIDGEIELTDKFGFKETIYIQSKNWDPDKGKEENWVVGETLLQQFIGACACRQAKDGKQHCRGIFVTTSRFTPDAKRILEDMSDKIVGYDGNDLYETAKECEFGIVKRNGEWVLDEKLLSGTKAFFNML